MKKYYSGQYPNDHWALTEFTLDDPKVVAICYIDKIDSFSSAYAIYLNPTDSRGYRLIVRYINNHRMQSTFNRPFSTKEQHGLSMVTELVERTLAEIVPIVQVFKAGNNSQEMKDGVVCIGTENEPNFLHSHVICRGDPLFEYITGFPLQGPIPGLNFDMMGKTPSQPGNDKKIPWTTIDMKVAKAFLQNTLDQVNFNEFRDYPFHLITRKFW